MSFKAIFVVLIVAVVGWSAYWWVNAGMRRDAVETWFAERQADGWVAEYGDLRVTGYPNRVDTILTDVALADPDSGWSWQGPRFEMLTLSYQPFEIIAVWPGQHMIASPYQRVSVEGEVLRASLAVSANGQFELDRARIEGRDVTIGSTAGWTVEVPELAVATQQPEDTPDPTRHRFGLTLTDATLSGDLRRQLDPRNLLPATSRPCMSMPSPHSRHRSACARWSVIPRRWPRWTSRISAPCGGSLTCGPKGMWWPMPAGLPRVA